MSSILDQESWYIDLNLFNGELLLKQVMFYQRSPRSSVVQVSHGRFVSRSSTYSSPSAAIAALRKQLDALEKINILEERIRDNDLPGQDVLQLT